MKPGQKQQGAVTQKLNEKSIRLALWMLKQQEKQVETEKKETPAKARV